jgi:hypothetical protein
MAAWYQLSEVGVLPFEVTPFTTAAFPLKVIEYGAARRLVVASPLAALEEASLPYVRLVDRTSVTAWAEAIASALDAVWNPSWDESLERYDWRSLGQRLSSFLAAVIVEPGGCDAV